MTITTGGRIRRQSRCEIETFRFENRSETWFAQTVSPTETDRIKTKSRIYVGIIRLFNGSKNGSDNNRKRTIRSGLLTETESIRTTSLLLVLVPRPVRRIPTKNSAKLRVKKKRKHYV